MSQLAVVHIRRARKAEHKQERREIILATALELFERNSFSHVTMAQIAQECGLAKGTVYLYFKTKEELFLALLDAELDAWFASVGTALSKGSAGKPAALANLAAASLAERRALRKLLAIMAGVLEHNVDFETALAFKERLATRARGGGALLESALTFLRPGEGTPLLLHLYGLAIGLQQLAEPAPVMQQALKLDHLKDFRIDFQKSFEDAARNMLEGMQKRIPAAKKRST